MARDKPSGMSLIIAITAAMATPSPILLDQPQSDKGIFPWHLHVHVNVATAPHLYMCVQRRGKREGWRVRVTLYGHLETKQKKLMSLFYKHNLPTRAFLAESSCLQWWPGQLMRPWSGPEITCTSGVRWRDGVSLSLHHKWLWLCPLTHMHAYTCTHAHTHACMRVHTHTHTHTLGICTILYM